jgi:hypothetical protein
VRVSKLDNAVGVELEFDERMRGGVEASCLAAHGVETGGDTEAVEGTTAAPDT